MTKVCTYCKKEIIGRRSDAKFCSQKCADAKHNKEYRLKNKEETTKYLERYRKNHRKEAKEYARNYRKDNADKVLAGKKKYYDKNIASILNRNNVYRKKKMDTDPLYKMTYSIRTLIGESLRRRGYKKTSRTAEILGCSFEEFKVYIEKQMPIGKSIKDLGYYKYHIDHDIPLASAKTKEDVIRLCHYTNLKPLWWKDNLSKSSKIKQGAH